MDGSMREPTRLVLQAVRPQHSFMCDAPESNNYTSGGDTGNFR
jgi:hypothetical protein